MLYKKEIIVLFDYSPFNLLFSSFKSYVACKILTKERLKLYKESKSTERKKEILAQGLVLFYFINCHLKLKSKTYLLNYSKKTRRAKLSFYKKKQHYFFFLNISHSKNFIALFASIAEDSAIDIEKPKNINEDFYKRVLSRKELENINKKNNKENKNIEFLKFWTCKEVYIKACKDKNTSLKLLDDNIYKKQKFNIKTFYLEKENLILSFGTKN